MANLQPLKCLTTLAVLIWLLVVCAGLRALLVHASTPGREACPPRTLPSVTDAERVPHLIFVAHPQCPCTRASLHELSSVLSRSHARTRTTVYFVLPDPAPKDWMQTENWRLAQAIPGVQVVGDVNGNIARQMGAQTSGETLLFRSDGRLLFSGGITVSRGHEGDNDAADALLERLEDKAQTYAHFPVFGCALPRFSGSLSPEGAGGSPFRLNHPTVPLFLRRPSP